MSTTLVKQFCRRPFPSLLHYLKSLLNSPYMCFALFNAWHYCLWFEPTATSLLDLTSLDVTAVWLLTLGIEGIFLCILPLAIVKIDLKKHKVFLPVAMVLLSIFTLVFCLIVPVLSDNPFSAISCFVAFILGLSSAIAFIFSSTCCTYVNASFTMREIAPVFMLIIIVSLTICTLLPMLVAVVFIAALPLAGIVAYRRTMKSSASQPKHKLLPKKARKNIRRHAIIFCIAGSVLSLSDTFAITIIPSSLIGVQNNANMITWTLVGGIIIISLALFCFTAIYKEDSSFLSMILLMALSIIVLVLAIKGTAISSTIAFGLGMGVCILLQLILFMFFGSLAAQGYFAPAIAFGLSEGIWRIGIFLGNSYSVILEQKNLVSTTLIQDTSLLFICLIGFLVVIAVCQQNILTGLLKGPLPPDRLEIICNDSAEEFCLSPRETEILKLLVRGNSIKAIAKKLVISTYTVQTHVQHIYRKMQFHKRSELIDYINLRREHPN